MLENNYVTLQPQSGWNHLLAEPFALRGTKKGQPFETFVFVGEVSPSKLDTDCSKLDDCVYADAPAGQVDASFGLVEVENYFNWVPQALALAELGDAEDALMDQDILWCKGAAFHDDATFNKVFCVLHLSGAPGDLVFPRLKARIPMKPGTFAIFDCREPHAFLNSGASEFIAEDYLNQERTFFAAQDLDPFDETIRLYFPEEARRQVPSRAYDVDSRTGAYIAR